MRRIYLPVAGLLVAFWLGVSVIYHLGFSGVRFGRGTAPVSFGREHDNLVIGLRDGYGLWVASKSPQPYFSVVKVRDAIVPFCWLCGRFELDGIVLRAVAFRDGPWLYRAPNESTAPKDQPAEAARANRNVAFNLATGEVLAADGAAAQAQQLASHGLVVRDGEGVTRLGPEQLADLTSLPMMQESCFVFNAAFVLLVGIWILVGIVLWIAGRRPPWR